MTTVTTLLYLRTLTAFLEGTNVGPAWADFFGQCNLTGPNITSSFGGVARTAPANIQALVVICCSQLVVLEPHLNVISILPPFLVLPVV